MKAPRFVKIYIVDNERRTLEHWYVRQKQWDIPAGRIEAGELPVDAAKRELLERTGYEIDTEALLDDGIEAVGAELFYRFKTTKASLRLVAAPGVIGGYETKIRWR